MAKTNTRDLTVGNLRKNLFSMAWPMMLGMLFHTAFNLTDSVYVGMLGANEIAAVSLFFPVVFIFIAIAGGLAVGATALVAQAIGANKLKEADNIAEHALLLAVFLGFAITVFGLLFAEPIFIFMGADEAVLPLAMDYASIIFYGMTFMFLSYMASSLIQAQGDAKTPMKAQGLTVALNIFLDPILMFGLFGLPALGVAGTALATVLLRGLMTVLLLVYLFKDRTKIRLRPKDFSFKPEIIKKIFVVGLPASIGQSINSIGMILLMTLVGGFGTLAIAAYGIGFRLDSLVLLPAMGMGQAVITMVGQNYGKKEFQRAIDSVKYAAISITAISLVFSALMFFFPVPFFLPFTSDPGVIALGATYLTIVAFSYVFKASMISFNSGFQGTGKTYISMILMGGSWVLTIGLGWYLSQEMGLNGIWWALLVSSAITAILSYLVYKTKKWL